MTMLEPGTALPELSATPTPVTLFRFSALTWNPHRIHYDAPYAATEGYPGPLVQSHLHGCLLLEAVLRWAPDGARLNAFSWQNRSPAIPGETLTVRGEITAAEDGVVSLRLEETDSQGVVCATGAATVSIQEGTVTT